MAAAKVRRAQRKALQAMLKRSDEDHSSPPPVASDLVHASPE
jgi:hypothetical protein